MLRTRIFLALIVLTMAVGCKAQPTSPISPHSAHRIEIMVRSQFNVPQNYEIYIADRKPSDIPNYDALTVVISHGEKMIPVDFLISKDGNTLARLETFNLETNPVFNISVADRPIRGTPQAKVTVINFDDLECPFCARMHESLFTQIMERYKGKVRFIYKDNPLTEIHPWAMHAAINANCLAAESSDAYWSYVDYLHSHGQEVDGTDRKLATVFATLDRIANQEAAKAKFSADKQTKFAACLAKQDDAEVRASMQEATTLHIQAAPALFINGDRIEGDYPDQVSAAIDRALHAEGVEPPSAQTKSPAQQSSAAGK